MESALRARPTASDPRRHWLWRTTAKSDRIWLPLAQKHGYCRRTPGSRFSRHASGGMKRRAGCRDSPPLLFGVRRDMGICWFIRGCCVAIGRPRVGLVCVGVGWTGESTPAANRGGRVCSGISEGQRIGVAPGRGNQGPARKKSAVAVVWRESANLVAFYLLRSAPPVSSATTHMRAKYRSQVDTALCNQRISIDQPQQAYKT